MATKKTPAAKKPAKKAAAKPVKVAIDVATFEQAAAREINVRLQKATEIEGKADDHRLAAALKLAEAKAKCDAASINFKKWCEANVEQKFETVRKLAVVGAAKEPAKALADLREGTRQSVAKSREKAKAAKALPAPSLDAKTVIETAMATLPDAEATKLVTAEAKKRGLFQNAPAVAPRSLDGAKFAFDELDGEAQVALLVYVGDKLGAEVTLMGQQLVPVAKAPEAPAPQERTRRKRVA